MKNIESVIHRTILLILVILHTGNSFPCQNGATYDAVYDRCECTPNYFGYRCETAFASDDPCQKESELPVIEDPRGNYRPGAADRLRKNSSFSKDQTMPSVFSEITPQWYRILSPWGNRLVEGCSSGVKDSDCGGRAAYVLHDVAAEEEKPKNRALFKARAFRVWSHLKSCRLAKETFYPIRILKCSQTLTLYFLLPLPRTHSYCIGDESDPSGLGLANMLVPKKPRLQLKYDSQGNADFYCFVFGTRFKKHLYTIKFVLTARDGTMRSINGCNKSRQEIPPSCNGNCSFVCPWFEIANRNENIYGSNLECSVQSENLSVPEISSEVHSFTFSCNFTNGFDTIRPGKPVELCISTWNIPTNEKITFSLSVARQIKHKKDRIDIAALSNEANSNHSACEIETSASPNRKKREVCMKFVLYNEDYEGKFVYGLEETEQLSVAQINVSYKSSANGIFTGSTSPVPVPSFEHIESRNLKVNLRSLNSGPQSYLHVFSDPFVKPVGGIYKDGSTYNLKAKRGENDTYIAMRHKLLPYEVQILITRPQLAVRDSPDASVVTRVAVRYDYIVIIISGNANEYNGALKHRVHCKAPKPSNSSSSDAIRQNSQCDVQRNGIEIESTSDVVRIQFKIYGTIIYVWKFRANLMVNSSCANRFIMSRREMKNTACRGGIHPVGNGKEFALDVTVIPSMYDYKGNVEGLMYAKNLIEAGNYVIRSPRENLFSNDYKATRPQQRRSQLNQPFEVMKICKCGQSSKLSQSQGCLVDVTNIKRTKREIPDVIAVNEAIDSPKSSLQLFNENSLSVEKQISQTEAQKFCSEFLSVQMVERNYSLSVCSGHSDHPIGTDYSAQFEFLCIRYAVTLRTYQFAETLLNSMLGACREDISYNASEFRNDSQVLKDLERDICPNDKCGANGICLAGACECKPGFFGRGCENRIEELGKFPIRILISNQDFVCASGNCSSALLLVTPLLRSSPVADCLIRQIVSSTEELSPTKRLWKIRAIHATDSVMVCNVSEIHSWLRAENRLYVVTEISLEAATWKSNNSVKRLLVQSECLGRPTKCQKVPETASRTSDLMASNGWTCSVTYGSTPAASLTNDENSCRQDKDALKKNSKYELHTLVAAMLIVIIVAACGCLYALRGRISNGNTCLIQADKNIRPGFKRIAKWMASTSTKRGAAGRKRAITYRQATEKARETLI